MIGSLLNDEARDEQVRRHLRRRTLLTAAAALILGDAGRADDRNQASTERPPVLMDESGFTVRSPDDFVNLHFGGRLHIDFGSGGSPAVTDAFPINFAVRRMWIEPNDQQGPDLSTCSTSRPASRGQSTISI